MDPKEYNSSFAFYPHDKKLRNNFWIHKVIFALYQNLTEIIKLYRLFKNILSNIIHLEKAAPVLDLKPWNTCLKWNNWAIFIIIINIIFLLNAENHTNECIDVIDECR